ncbi:hypothetical protein AVEN_224071-1, partial [Araneus ventricosus]
MVTSKFALTCCNLVVNLRSCRVELDASFRTCIARLLQLCCKVKFLYGAIPLEYSLSVPGFLIIISVSSLVRTEVSQTPRYPTRSQQTCVAEDEDRYHLKEDAGSFNITNMPFIYNRLKPTFTYSFGVHASSRNPNNWIRWRL